MTTQPNLYAERDITERLREHAAIHEAQVPFDNEQREWADDLRFAAAEIARLRARVAELEAIRRLVLFETSEDADGYMPHHPREALFVLRSAANGTAPPAPTVDVDAISKGRLMDGTDAYFREKDAISELEELTFSDRYERCMRAALRAIFNKGE